MTVKLVNVFFGVSMSNGHKGLNERILKAGKDLDAGMSVFINKKWTALKVITPDDTILHYKSPSNRPIEPGVIKYLPRTFNGSRLNYNKALEMTLTKEYGLLPVRKKI
jgi:hypothetical protein